MRPWTPLPAQLLGLALFAACGAEVHPEVELEVGAGTGEQSAIYGIDDRKDIYQEMDPMLRGIATGSVALLTHASRVNTEGGGYPLDTLPLEDAYQLCEGERFGTQPSVEACSGTLIGEDLLLTAGHCVGGEAFRCEDLRIVFDYLLSGPGQLQVPSESSIYRCQEVLFDEYSPVDAAVIRLDRVAEGRNPVPVARELVPVEAGAPLTVIGFPSGLPMKTDSGGQVLNPHADELVSFDATTDTFAGNSGSGIFSESGTLVGILVSGQADYFFDNTAGCYRAMTYSADPDYGEQATYAARAMQSLCASEAGVPLPLCGQPECGDGVCQVSESATCAADCRVVAAPSTEAWSCAPQAYDSGNGCDCGCGAFDPDCADPEQPVLGCGEGAVCSVGGACQDEVEYLKTVDTDLAPPEGSSCTQAGRFSPWFLVLLGYAIDRRRRSLR